MRSSLLPLIGVLGVLGGSVVAGPWAVTGAGRGDGGFGQSGIVRTDFGGDDQLNAVAIQSDGKILVAGSSGSMDFQSSMFALARYESDGTLDRSFGIGGKLLTAFGSQTPNYLGAVVVQTDGKIVAAGTSAGHVGLVRYERNGDIDQGFGRAGYVRTAFPVFEVSTVAIQTDGKIVAAGWTEKTFALARYTSNGSLDKSFGSGGKVVTYFGQMSGADDLAIQRDGKIVVAGAETDPSPRFVLARYTPGGRLDPTFGSRGKILSRFGGAFAIERDGKIITVGSAAGASGNSPMCVLVRYTANGILDTSFGPQGKMMTYVGHAFTGIAAVAIQYDGKIVGGGGGSRLAGHRDFLLVRFNPGGSLDR